MAASSNIPHDLKENIRDVLDKRVKVSLKRLIKMEVRADKLENRILAFSPCRLFVLTAKVPSKLENSFHFLDIQAIESKKPNQLTLVIDGKPYNFVTLEADSDEVDHMITHIGISLKQIFPSFPLERLILKIDVLPADRLKVMNDMNKSLEKKEPAPCGGFTTMYQCMCDYYGFPFREEVAWDVDTIYLSHDSRELRLQDFDHLTGRDLVPIIGALEHNTWFKRINASNVKLTAEACSEIIKVMKRNAVIEEVNLSNTGIKVEFLQKFALAIISNSGSQLTSLDISNNQLEDKAISHLLGSIKLLPCGLTSLDVSRTGITTRCLSKIGEVLAQTPSVMASLTTLKVNDNGVKGDDFPMLYNCLAQPNVISYLDVSSTDCTLDAICDPLLRGCPSLVTLKASRTVFTHKKNKDVHVPLSWKQLFSNACFLEHLDFSSCKLPTEALKDLLLGLSCNRNLKGLFLDLSSNEFCTAGANVLASCISTISCIKGIDISNNGFDIDLKSLLPEISKNTHVKYLSIGRNFANIKPKHMPEVMEALTTMLQEETCTLESVSFADSKLKTDATYIINALGSNNSLQEIDISGNLIGDFGARLLAKALLINNKLRKVVWDKNSVSAQGFEDMAEALQKNITLRQMPFPVNDAAAALRLYPERTEIALQKIESLLQRNHSPRRFASDKAYRLQQGFLLSSTQQMVDRLIVQVQDTVNALRNLGTMDVYDGDLVTAEKLMTDANNSRHLFSGLQDIAMQSQDKGNPVDKQLQEMAEQLKVIIEEQMQKTADAMLKCTVNSCPSVMANSTFQAVVKENCHAKSTLPKDFTLGVLEGASTDIYNMTSEKNLANAAYISDSVIEAVIDTLTSSHTTLTSHLNLRKSGFYQEKEPDKLEDNEVVSRTRNTEEVSSKHINKRKSLLSRRTRPQSTVGGEEALTLMNKSVEVKEVLQNLEEINAERTQTDQVNDVIDLPSSSTRPLEHVTKGRPRREKMHRPTRPIIARGTTEMEEGPSNGLHPSYQTQVSQNADCKEVVKDGKEDSPVSPKPEPVKTKPEDSSSKKWMPGFMKKSQEEKAHKEAKKSSFGSSFSSMFKKKDEKRRPSGSESSENKMDVPTSNVPQTSDQGKAKISKDLETVSESEPVLKSIEDSIKLPEAARDLETPSEKLPLTPKTPKERPPFDRVAILPPFKKLEARATPLATEEDTSLDDLKNDSKEAPATEPQSNGTESNKDGAPKLPASVAKMPGISVLGGKNLLEEMKLKQEKRFSKIPSVEEEKSPGRDKLVKEANNKTVEDISRDRLQDSSSSSDVHQVSPSKKPSGGALPTVDGSSKKDLNDNSQEPSSTCLPAKPDVSPQPPSKAPVFAPRVAPFPKRPVSTVEEGDSTQEIPQSMTTSTPELLLGDSTSSKLRPIPPVKPRPAIVPRQKKKEPGKDSGTEERLGIGEKPSAEVSNIELRQKPSSQDEGIVTDSATLRLSVKDKIKRLSQAQAKNDIQVHTPPSVKQKTVSLPRDSQLIEEKPGEPEGNSKSDSSKNKSQAVEGSNDDAGEERSSETSASSTIVTPDDEIMV